MPRVSSDASDFVAVGHRRNDSANHVADRLDAALVAHGVAMAAEHGRARRRTLDDIWRLITGGRDPLECNYYVDGQIGVYYERERSWTLTSRLITFKLDVPLVEYTHDASMPDGQHAVRRVLLPADLPQWPEIVGDWFRFRRLRDGVQPRIVKLVVNDETIVSGS